MSFTTFKTSHLHPLGRLVVGVLRVFRLVHVQDGVGEDGQYTECNNFTLINLVLKFTGPLHERTLVTVLLLLQVK